MRRFLLLTTIAVVLLAGCGGGDDDSESSKSASQSTTAPADTRPTAEQDKQRAGRIVLTAADLPGYTEDTSPDDDDEDERAFGECVQNDPVLTAEEPENPRTVEGKDFEKGNEQQVTSKATIAETQEQAQAALAQVRSQTVLNCLENGFRPVLTRSLDRGDTLDNLDVTSLPVASVGDESVGFRIAATVTTRGQRIPLAFDITVIRRERAVALLSTSAVGRSFSTTERETLASKIADRMGP